LVVDETNLFTSAQFKPANFCRGFLWVVKFGKIIVSAIDEIFIHTTQ
jgi:hypothetical protein